MLNYNIKGTGLEITSELRDYVEKRLPHAEKFLQGDTTAHVDVELQHDALRNGEHYRAEFTLSSHGVVYRASDWAGTAQAAIDIAIDELQRELRRDKRKRIHLFRRGAHKVKEFLQSWRG
jgi:putative sigma-54 modulation protein